MVVYKIKKVIRHFFSACIKGYVVPVLFFPTKLCINTINLKKQGELITTLNIKIKKY